MDFARLFRSRRFVPALGVLVAAFAPMAAARRAAPADNAAGWQLLQAQLPAGSSIRQTDCERLVRAVRLATLSHHRQATAILSAALTPDGTVGRAGKRSCECVVQLFRAAVNAAPDHASDLLETAEAICPECANGLATVLGRMEDKNVVFDPKDATADPATAGNDPRDLSARNYDGLGLSSRDNGTVSDHGIGGGSDNGSGTGTGTGTGAGSDPGAGFGTGIGTGTSTIGADSSLGGFGSGLGAGFPGSPGFSGSAPGGGFALPSPVSPAVTSVVNR